jgi:hypothetical protein
VRLPRNRRGGIRLALLTIVLAAATPVPHAPAQPAPATPPRDVIGQADIDRALERVKADPNLATERTIPSLRWSDQTPFDLWNVPRWIAGVFRWLTQSARLLMWTAAAIFLALIAVYIVRLVRARRTDHAGSLVDAPTHVRDLDIRPESLPADVGAAARALWDRGEPRAALALLYRGLLSRLAHVHRVPIRDSTTEGDCLALATTYLTDDRRSYAARLVLVWQRGVYGGQAADTAAVHGLCDAFASMLDAGAQGALPAAEGR